MATQLWTGSYPIRTDEIDAFGHVTLVSLLAYLQDAAAHHARDLGFSVAELMANNRSWVLARLRLVVTYYPSWGQTIRVETWPSGVENLLACRDYRLYDEQGSVFAKAVSSWLMFDLNRRRPVRLPVGFDGFIKRERALPQPNRGAVTETRVQNECRFQIRPTDTDFNGHLNHVRCVEWLINGVSQRHFLSARISEVEVEFKGEGLSGEEVSVQTGSVDSDQTVRWHRLIRCQDQRLLAAARTHWSAEPGTETPETKN